MQPGPGLLQQAGEHLVDGSAPVLLLDPVGGRLERGAELLLQRLAQPALDRAEVLGIQRDVRLGHAPRIPSAANPPNDRYPPGPTVRMCQRLTFHRAVSPSR